MDEANEVASAIAQGDEQTDDNAQLVRDILLRTAELVRENASLVNEEVNIAFLISHRINYALISIQIVTDVVEVLNGLQDWPDDVIQTDDAGAQ